MTSRGLTIVALAASIACGVKADGPPAIHVDRTPCFHCGMLVSEPAYAAAYRAPGADPHVFDDIRCLLEAARKEPRADAIRFWFHDAASGVWIDAGEAMFVASPTLRTPMGGGLIAYRDLATAREAAARQQGHVINSVGDLLRSVSATGGRSASRQDH